MARRIEHLTTSTWPASDVFSALVDETYLKDRLKVLGGADAQLLSFSAGGGTTSYQLKQGVAAEHLPSVARNLLGGDLVIQRAESWTEAGRAGTVEVTINGVPGRLDGTFTLAENGGGSKLTLTGQVKVSIPLVGGKLETMIAEQVAVLLDKENEFTTEWLANRA
jgi:predicted lysophospholipase L1 biosynthesis ABC-type transport system permease subunit